MLIIATLLAIAGMVIWLIDVLNSGQGGLDLGWLWKCMFIGAAICVLADFYWSRQDTIRDVLPESKVTAEP